MATFFGFEERIAQGFIENNMVCLPHSPDGKTDLHSIVSAIKNEDIVFIKHCTPETSLHIKAIGIVQSDFPLESAAGVCLPVEWVWRGEKIIGNFDEMLPFCGNALYEEHDILVQKEIINMLPQKYQLPQEW